MTSSKKTILVASAYALVLSLIVLFLYPVMVYDPTARYAPMADAFARGDFFFAYHPRFGVLFPSLAGALAFATGLAGDKACQLVAILFLAASGLVAWHLAKRVFKSDAVAWVAMILLLSAGEYVVYAADGLRESLRIFGLGLVALAFAGAGGGTMALGLFTLATLRTDLILISGVFLFAWMVWSLCRGGLKIGVKASVAPLAAWLLGVNLMCLMTFAFTKIYLPGAQFVKLYLKMKGAQ